MGIRLIAVVGAAVSLQEPYHFKFWAYIDLFAVNGGEYRLTVYLSRVSFLEARSNRVCKISFLASAFQMFPHHYPGADLS